MTVDATTDPRLGLRTRIRAIQRRLEFMEVERAKLIRLLATYNSLLEMEDGLVQQAAANMADDFDEALVPAFHPTRDRHSLADLILRVLGTGPKTLEDLKQIGAAAWAPIKDSAHPGRAINFALVGLQKGKHVERLKDGRWKLVSAEAEEDAERSR